MYGTLSETTQIDLASTEEELMTADIAVEQYGATLSR